jgi:hypothetical protein
MRGRASVEQPGPRVFTAGGTTPAALPTYAAASRTHAAVDGAAYGRLAPRTVRNVSEYLSDSPGGIECCHDHRALPERT